MKKIILKIEIFIFHVLFEIRGKIIDYHLNKFNKLRSINFKKAYHHLDEVNGLILDTTIPDKLWNLRNEYNKLI